MIIWLSVILEQRPQPSDIYSIVWLCILWTSDPNRKLWTDSKRKAVHSSCARARTYANKVIHSTQFRKCALCFNFFYFLFVCLRPIWSYVSTQLLLLKRNTETEETRNNGIGPPSVRTAYNNRTIVGHRCRCCCGSLSSLLSCVRAEWALAQQNKNCHEQIMKRESSRPKHLGWKNDNFIVCLLYRAIEPLDCIHIDW